MHIVVAVLLQIGRFAEKFTNIWGNIPIVKCYGFVIHLLRRGVFPVRQLRSHRTAERLPVLRDRKGFCGADLHRGRQQYLYRNSDLQRQDLHRYAGRDAGKTGPQLYRLSLQDATCEGDGSQTATCDRCDATDTKSVPGSAGCTLHEVDGVQICPVCGKVNGIVKLNKVSAAADDSASVYSAQLVVRVGTLPNGRKIITVTFLNAEGQAITLYDAQKIRVSLAALNAQLGETGAQSFAHTLTSLNTANGEKSNVGFAVENGTLIFDAPFQSSTACVLLVD